MSVCMAALLPQLSHGLEDFPIGSSNMTSVPPWWELLIMKQTVFVEAGGI